MLTPAALPAGFIYNTEPACRALVVARELNAERVWPLVKSMQSVFYTQALDITQCSVLADLAEQAGYSRGRFSKAFIAEPAHTAVAADLRWVADLGIRGFPTLLAERNGMLALLTNGYQLVESVLSLLQRWVEAAEAGAV